MRQFIIIKKLSEVPGGLPAAKKDSYAYGIEVPEGKSIPVEYEIEGQLLTEITIGKPVKVFRHRRNDVNALGVFETSLVTDMSPGIFRTENSVYQYKFISQPSNLPT